MINSDRIPQQVDASLLSRLRGHSAGHPDPEALDILLSLIADDDQGNDLVVLQTAAALVQRATERLHEHADRRPPWLKASVQVTKALLRADTDEALQLLASGARNLTGASAASVEVPVGASDVLVQAYDGPAAVQLRGRRVPLSQSPLFRQVSQTREALLIDSAADDPRVTTSASLAGLPMDSVIVAPMMTQTRPLGALILAADNPDRPLTDVDAVMAMDFASHAALVYEFAAGQSARAQLAVLADRERLAAEVSRRIVSKLFAIGLTLQGLMDEAADSIAAAITACVDDLDSAIAEIRGAIFDASASEASGQSAL